MCKAMINIHNIPKLEFQSPNVLYLQGQRENFKFFFTIQWTKFKCPDVLYFQWDKRNQYKSY